MVSSNRIVWWFVFKVGKRVCTRHNEGVDGFAAFPGSFTIVPEQNKTKLIRKVYVQFVDKRICSFG